MRCGAYGRVVAPRELLYPQLRAFDAGERDAALRRARDAPFDVVELVGLALGLVMATAITSHGGRECAAAGCVLAALVNFVVALPILAVLVGPFLVRHVRRGLARELEARAGQGGA